MDPQVPIQNSAPNNIVPQQSPIQETVPLEPAPPPPSIPQSLSSNHTKRNIFIIVLVLFVFLGGSVFLLSRTLELKTKDSEIEEESQTSYSLDDSDSESGVSPMEMQQTSSENSSDWSMYVSHVEEPNLLPLTKENKGKFHPNDTTLVPYVLEDHTDTQVVYTDFGQAMLTIPKGWYGIEGDQKNGVFRDFEHKLLLRIGFSDMGTTIDSIDSLLAFLNSDEVKQSLGSNSSRVVIEKYDSDHVLVDLTEVGGGYIVYRLTPNNPTFVHKTALTAADDSTLSKTQIQTLLRKIIDSEKVIGIDPNNPNERVDFLAAHNILMK